MWEHWSLVNARALMRSLCTALLLVVLGALPWFSTFSVQVWGRPGQECWTERSAAVWLRHPSRRHEQSRQDAGGGLVCWQAYPGAGFHGDAGLGCQPAGPYCHHQGHSGWWTVACADVASADTAEIRFSVVRWTRFWVSGYCTKWRIQGSFHSSYSRSLNVKTWPRNSILSLDTFSYVH